MAVPYTFGSATASIPLSQLDSNFATTITLGNTAVQLGNTITNLTGVSNVASATSLSLGSNGNTTAMTVDTSQNVLVGTTTAIGKFGVLTPTSGYSLAIQGRSTDGQSILSSTDRSGTVYTGNLIFLEDGSIVFGKLNTGSQVEAMRIDTNANLKFNSGYGSVATAYGCRAWVNFDGTGTPAIRASGNVSSITDLATGTYTVNLTNAMPDANYAIQISSGFASGVREDVFGVLYNDAPYTPTTTAYTIKFYRADTNVAVDSNYSMTSIFR